MMKLASITPDTRASRPALRLVVGARLLGDQKAPSIGLPAASQFTSIVDPMPGLSNMPPPL
jgi:hypothetical protein